MEDQKDQNKEWFGSPLDMAMDSMDPHGVQEVVIEYSNGDSDVFRPKQRDAFGSYELHQFGTYLDTVAHDARYAVGR